MTASAATSFSSSAGTPAADVPAPHICILGGGFGGLYTALRLSQLTWAGDTGPRMAPQITLVDQNDRFGFLPLLYELLTRELETWEIAPPFEELLLGTGIRFIQGKVNHIDTNRRRVSVTPVASSAASQPHEPISEQTLTYDRLVLALGGETPMDLVPGAAEHAIPFRAVEDAYRLEEALRRCEASKAEKIRIVVAGGGYSGVELACKLAERLGDRGRVRIVELSDQILRTSPEFNREAARKALEQQGVWVDLETQVKEIRANEIDLAYKAETKAETSTLPVDIVVWTVGTAVVPVVQALDLPKNERGKICICPTLDVVNHPEIFALGDLAVGQDADAQSVPATAQAAFQQADYAGWNVWASLTQRPLLPFRYQNLGEMMSLGTQSATLTGLGLTLDGPLAYLARRMVYLYRMPTLEHQLRVGFNWMTKPLQDLLSSVK